MHCRVLPRRAREDCRRRGIECEVRAQPRQQTDRYACCTGRLPCGRCDAGSCSGRLDQEGRPEVQACLFCVRWEFPSGCGRSSRRAPSGYALDACAIARQPSLECHSGTRCDLRSRRKDLDLCRRDFWNRFGIGFDRAGCRQRGRYQHRANSCRRYPK
jgi:hypothetical protein